MRVVHFLILALLLLLFPPSGKTYAAAYDLQSRFALIIPVSVSDGWQIRTGFTRIYFNDISELELQAFFAGPYYRISSGLKTGLEYRYMDKQINGQWVPENRLSSVFVLNKRFSPWSLLVRKRLEYRSRSKGYGIEWRGRSFIKIALSNKGITPYLSNELFYNLSEGEMNRNKFKVGLDIPIVKELKTGIHYEYETEKFSKNWEGLNIIGTSFVLVL